MTAFTSRPAKFDEARGFGAHRVVSTRDADAVKKIAGSLDLLVVTANVPLDWDGLFATMPPNGRLHLVGAVQKPIPVTIFPLIIKPGSLSASPTGSPLSIARMLEFASWHRVAPTTEHYPLSRINEASERLEAGKARYRIVLDAEF